MQAAHVTSQEPSHGPQGKPQPPKKLICIAWMIEIVAILVSLSLAVYPVVVAQNLLLNGWLGAAPFLVIAAAEFSKIPLVEALFRIKGLLLSALTSFAIVVICLNTFYTVSNGFERAHNAKTKNIEEVKREKLDAVKKIINVKSGLEKAESERNSIDQTLEDITRVEEKELSGYWDATNSLLAQKGHVLLKSRIDDIRRKYGKEKADLLDDRKRLSDHIDSLRSYLVNLQTVENEAESRLNALIYDNQIYRFAAMIYGYDDPAQMPATDLNTFCFVWFGLVAFAVSVLGPFLSLCYYRIKYQDARTGGAWHALLRSARRLLIRLARRNKIVKIEEREVERVIEKPVEVQVFRDVIREIPVETVVVREIEVVREVPVEKIVVKEVLMEVPVDRIVPYERLVEVEKKEIIYLPIYTNDPDILKAQAA